MIRVIRNSFLNIFHLGSVQATNIFLQLLLIPIVVRKVGIEANGFVLTSLSLAGFISIFINYASNQTGPIEIKLGTSQKSDKGNLTALFSIRFIFFFLYILIALFTYFLKLPFAFFLLGIIPVIFAEVINPYIYFLGLEQLKYYNLANLFSRFSGLILVFYFVNKLQDAPWVNALVGISQVSGFIFLWLLLIVKNRIAYAPITIKNIIKAFKENLPLTVSNLAVHFQQSVFLYGLGFMGNPVVLGAYAIADKLIWGVRMVLIAFSNAIYPRAIEVFHQSAGEWILFRKQVNKLLSLLLLLIGALLFICSHNIALLLSEKDDITLVERYIRLVSPVPLVIGLNVLNVMELLMKKMFTLQLKLSIQVFVASFLFALFSLFILPPDLSVVYLLIIEIICLIFYEKNRRYSS